jgi:sugar phosphate isomerase/epimerase
MRETMTSIKLACADFTFPLLTHDKALQLIAMLNVTGVDIGLFEQRSHLWPSQEFTNPTRSARQLKAKLDDLGLQIADLFMQLANDFQSYAVNQPDATRRAHARDSFLKLLDYASEATAHHVLILPGAHFDEEPKATSFGRAVDELVWRIEQAEQRNIVCAIEAHVGSIVPDPASAADLIRRVPGLTLALDYTHFTRVGIPDAEIEPLIAYASHFHIRGARPGRLQTRFAENTIDYRRVVEVARAHHYQGWFGLEYVWQEWEHCNECDNVSETILFRDYLRALSETDEIRFC